MKIYKYIICVMAIILLVYAPVCAGTKDTAEAWTHQKVRTQSPDGHNLPSGIYIYEIVYMADSAGAFTTTTLNQEINGYILGIETIPSIAGSFTDTTFSGFTGYTTLSAPTTLYDVYVRNSSGRDLLGGTGVDRSAINAEYVRPALNSSWGALETYGDIDIVVSNAGAWASGAIRIYYYSPYRTPY